ncbi:hypothetical protein FACS1894103_0610 [Campylobacterota bacterium]|nr:hypothetical protein FACS1894103_0500 [Campylobacterota bacterium]GHV58696.1 hypothetical protein FACS1894103_0610 [Campylobacterota bacterium]
MKAIKFSVAAAAALALATVASADGLTAYGQVSGEVGSYFDKGANTNKIGVHSYASRFGLKGAADVGGGLTAVYQLEAGFNGVNGANSIPGAAEQDAGSITPSNGNNQLASRNTFAGVAGGFGTFVIGNHDTPYKIVARGSGAITSADTVADLHLNTDRRLQGAVAYIAPADALGGVTLAVAVVPVKDVNGSQDNSGFHYSVGALIPAGDLATIGVGYESAYVPALDDSITSIFAGAGFNFDAIKVGVAVEQVTAGDKLGKDLGTTAVLVPFSITLDDGLYVNAGVKYTKFDKGGAAQLTGLPGDIVDADNNVLQVSASVGKKWAKTLDLYAGAKLTQAKNEVIGSGTGKKKSATDFGVGLKVAF